MTGTRFVEPGQGATALREGTPRYVTDAEAEDIRASVNRNEDIGPKEAGDLLATRAALLDGIDRLNDSRAKDPLGDLARLAAEVRGKK